MCLAALWDVEAEPCREESPAHVWEGEEQQCSAPESIDSPYRRPGEDEVDQTEAPGREKCFSNASTSVAEDCRAVEGDDVDAALIDC